MYCTTNDVSLWAGHVVLCVDVIALPDDCCARSCANDILCHAAVIWCRNVRAKREMAEKGLDVLHLVFQPVPQSLPYRRIIRLHSALSRACPRDEKL